jgi:hypothetical protein
MFGLDDASRSHAGDPGWVFFLVVIVVSGILACVAISIAISIRFLSEKCN